MTTVPVTEIAEPGTGLAAARVPAPFSRRIQAVAIDILVQGTTLVGLMSLLEMSRGHHLGTGVAFAGWLGFALLYEPVLVSRRGATLGHSMARLRVVDLATGGHPDAASALARFWLKATSGILAVVAMAVTPRHRALHDLAVGTSVEDAGR